MKWGVLIHQESGDQILSLSKFIFLKDGDHVILNFKTGKLYFMYNCFNSLRGYRFSFLFGKTDLCYFLVDSGRS